MTKKKLVLGLIVALAGTVSAQEGAVPKGIPPLDHVWVIMMENHGYSQILNNPNAPYINAYAQTANLADRHGCPMRRSSCPRHAPADGRTAGKRRLSRGGDVALLLVFESVALV